MKKLSKRILSSLPAVTFLVVCVTAIYFQLESVLGPISYEYFALDSPTFEVGANSAQPLIHDLKIYKAEFQYYPPNLAELPTTQNVIYLSFPYKYEPDPSTEKPQEYMLSFRKRWSIHDQYCYYSGDGAWLQSSDPCWDTLRTTRGLKLPLADYR